MTDNFELGLSSIPLVTPVLLDRSGAPITGSSTIVAEIRRFGTSDRWDFNDNTFKTSGWTTRQGPLTAVSDSLDPGIYERVAGWVATSVVAGFYVITYRDTASSALPAIEGVRLGGPADTIATNLNTKIANVTGTASAGSSTSITLAGLSAVDDFYRFSIVEITGGTGSGQSRTIVAYVGSTKVATVNRAWATNPDSTSTFAIRASSQPVILDAGLAQAGGASTITLRSTSSATDSLYVGATVVIMGGTGAGQERVITAYVGSTKVATLATAWTTQPDSTSVYALLPVGRSITVSNLDKTGYGVTSVATDAIDAAAVKADAVTKIQTGMATSTALGTAQSDLTAIKGTGFTAGVDDLHASKTAAAAAAADITTIKNYGAPPTPTAISDVVRAGVTTDHGSGDYIAPATVTLADASLTAAKVGTGLVDLVQNGLASRATMVFDAEIGESPLGESVYFPYFKNGTAVIGATVTMMISRIGLADPGPGYEFQTLDFASEIFVPPGTNTDPLITMSPVDASTPGVYTAYAYVSGFATNSVKPDVYTVWFFDGAELVGMGRLRAGTTDIVAALPTAITDARDHVEASADAQFLLVKGATFDTETDSLEALRNRGDSAWMTANISGLATSTNVTDARDHVEAYGQVHWLTATGFAVAGDAMTLADATLLPTKIGAGFVTAMQANLALEASLTAMKGASFDGATDSMRAIRVLVSAIPTAGAPSAATIRDAVWAIADDGADGTALGKLTLLHSRQTGRRKMGNDGYELIYGPDNVTVIKKTLVKDINGDIVVPGAGDPSEVSQEMDP